ncbi:aldo/keto reductase family oxidoreductase [Aquitalea sp. LB_tupeE]|uniref:aldo/keto reductase n=1 Tax=Aquitalea sp. LB_tupeE TaxID=2748078 RepID=UPI00351A2B70
MAAGLWRLHDWNFSTAELANWIEHAIQLGITTFDHADLYGGFRCEALFGQWLKANPGQREHIQLVSKCGIKPADASRGWQVKHYDSSRAHILASVDASLQNLGTDYLDLLLIHRPDPLMNPDEVADTFASLRQSGKVRHFGVSNFSPSQFALLSSRTVLLTNQVEASLLHTAPLFDGRFDQCLQAGIRPMVWSPLAGGRLLQTDARTQLHATLLRIASELGVSPATLALAWLLRHPARPIPISGSRRLASLDEAAAACRLQLDRQHWFALLEAAHGQPVA